MDTQEKRLHTLIPLEDFKSVLGIDGREDNLARYCLVTATYTIEQHCMRRLLRRKHSERIECSGDLVLPLREYPVSKVLAVYALSHQAGADGEFVGKELYSLNPDSNALEDWPYAISLSPAIKRFRYIEAFKVVYSAGYTAGNVPPDLASACLELAAWNMNRYKGRRVGMVGNVRGHGKDGEHFELSMPENVRLLLEPYRRKVI